MWRSLFSSGRIILLLLCCVISGRITAQKAKLDTLNPDQLDMYYHKAVKMRNGGIVLTLSGVAIVVTSTIIGNLPDDSDPNDTGDPAHDGISIWAIAFADLVGGSLTLAGIPLWVTGGSRKSRAEIALKKYQTVPVNTMALGIGLVIKF